MNAVVTSTKQKNLLLEQALKSSQEEVQNLKQCIAETKQKKKSPALLSELRAKHSVERGKLEGVIARQQVHFILANKTAPFELFIMSRVIQTPRLQVYIR